MVKQINILIIEGSAVIRRGIIALLEEAEFANIDIMQSADMSPFTSTSKVATPDVIIINTSFFGMVAPEQLRTQSGNEELKVIAMQSALVESALLHPYDEIISIYDSVDTIKDKLLRQIQKDEEERDSKRELSQREKEIIVCVVKGMTNKQIAETLYISTHTVIAHRRNIAGKLQIHSPAGLTIFAIVNKLVDLSEIKNSISRAEAE